MDDKKQLAIYEKAKAFLPSLMQAVRETAIEKKQERLIKIFRLIDTKKTELQIMLDARALTVSKREKITKEGGIVVTVEKVQDSRNIDFMVKKLGRDEVVAVVRLLLANVNEYFNRKQALSLMQIKEIAEQIIDECGETLFIDELIYIFKKAKTNARVYQSIDGNIIFEWIDEHYRNRENQLFKKHESEKYSDYKPQYAIDLAQKYFLVPEKVVRAHMDRDMKASGVEEIIASKTKKKKKNNNS